MASCQMNSSVQSQDIFDTQGLSKKATQCLQDCESDTTGPDLVERSKECACICHKTHATGRYAMFCTAESSVKKQKVMTIHDNSRTD